MDTPAGASGETPRAAVLRAMASRDEDEPYTLEQFNALMSAIRGQRPKTTNGNGNGRH
jgi:hypothetical protein